ncbi:MAG: aldo/keto reductase [Planctomycetota bacterium]
MVHNRLGQTDLHVSPIGFGAFKIGRNVGTKYPRGYDLPADDDVSVLLNTVVDMGINYIDTAPAYGLSEARIGAALHHRRDDIVLSTKVGERFDDGQSSYTFSASAVRTSLESSLRALRTDAVDLVLVHSDGNDLDILHQTDTVDGLLRAREDGLTRCIGFSGKSVAGAAAALPWSDVIMVEYHANDTSHDAVMRDAHAGGVGVVVKKGLASGHLAPPDAIPFVLRHPAVDSLVIGGLNAAHIRENLDIASTMRQA